MTKVCISKNLGVDSGVLKVEPWSVFRHVADTTTPATGDGTIVQTDYLPGKLMVQAGLAWTSDAPIPLQMVVRIQRGPRQIITSNPNAVQIRDRWTSLNSPIGELPEYPTTAIVFQSQRTLAGDLSTNIDTTPKAGIFANYIDQTMTEDLVPDLLMPGETVTVLYAAFAWTPPPFSNNANAGGPVHTVTVSWVRIQLMAIPAQDSGVITG